MADTAIKAFEAGLAGEGEQNAAPQILNKTSSREAVPLTDASTKELGEGDLTSGLDEKSVDHAGQHELRPEEAGYMSGLKLNLVFVGLMLSVFLFALDQSIVATAIPVFVSEFKAFDQVSWTVTAYFLTQCGLILLSGQLLSIVKPKWVLLGSLFVFGLGSLICGVAKSMEVLIFGRAIQGVGVSAMFSSIMLIITVIVRIEQRATYLASFGGVFVISSIVGPILGGVFTDHASWRWCFYINLPIIPFSALAVILWLPARDPPKVAGARDRTAIQNILRLDWIGTVFIFSIITCLLLAMSWGGNQYRWDSWRIILLFTLGGALVPIFGWWEYRLNERALIPQVILKNRTQIATCIAVFFTMGYFLGGVYQIPLFYEAVKDYSPTKAGISVIPFMLSACVAIFISGGLVQTFGLYYPFLLIGPPIAIIGNVLLYTIDAQTANPKLIGYQILAGFGCGLAFQNLMLAIQGEWHERPEYMAQAIGVSNMFQLTGAAIGIGLINVVQSVYLNKELSKTLPDDIFVKVRQSVTEIYQVDEQYRAAAIDAYLTAITRSFIPIFASVAIAWVASVFVRSHNMKTKGQPGAMAV